MNIQQLHKISKCPPEYSLEAWLQILADSHHELEKLKQSLSEVELDRKYLLERLRSSVKAFRWHNTIHLNDKLWSIVGYTMGLGSRSATELCNRLGFDPECTIRDITPIDNNSN
jgi:hypothetical protein